MKYPPSADFPGSNIISPSQYRALRRGLRHVTETVTAAGIEDDEDEEGVPIAGTFIGNDEDEEDDERDGDEARAHELYRRLGHSLEAINQGTPLSLADRRTMEEIHAYLSDKAGVSYREKLGVAEPSESRAARLADRLLNQGSGHGPSVWASSVTEGGTRYRRADAKIPSDPEGLANALLSQGGY